MLGNNMNPGMNNDMMEGMNMMNPRNNMNMNFYNIYFNPNN